MHSTIKNVMSAQTRGVLVRQAIASIVLSGAAVVGAAGAAAAAEPSDKLAESTRSLAAPPLPLAFEPNRGQMDSRAHFSARAGGMNVFVREDGFTFSVVEPEAEGGRKSRRLGPPEPRKPGDDPGPRKHTAIEMDLVGPRRGASKPTLLDPQPGVTNYLVGDDPTKWVRNVPRYGKVVYEEAYAGVDLVLYNDKGQFAYDFVVKPGADASQIAFRIKGARKVSMGSKGQLVLETPAGRIEHRAPVSFQEDQQGRRKAVSSQWRVDSSGQVRFAVGAYDRSKPVRIDPAVTYYELVTNTTWNNQRSITSDIFGNSYFAGQVSGTGFPSSPGTQPYSDWFDGYLIKLSPTGQLRYATFIGGSDRDIVTAVEVDAFENVWLVGYTDSTNFPRVPAAGMPGGRNAFVARFNAEDGYAPRFIKLLHGSRGDEALDSEIDDQGNLLITGWTESLDFAGANTASSAQGDGYLVKVTPLGQLAPIQIKNADGTIEDPVLVTFGASNGQDWIDYLEIAPDGSFWFTGRRSQADGVAMSPDAPYTGDTTMFVGNFALDPFGWKFRTRWPGQINGLDVDKEGAVYIGGQITNTYLPLVNAYQQGYNTGPWLTGSGTAAFIAKLAPNHQLVYSTYYGGVGPKTADGKNAIFDWGDDVAVDHYGYAYLAGTRQDARAWHDLGEGGPGCNEPDDMAWVTRFDPSGQPVSQSLFDPPENPGECVESADPVIAVDANGQVYLGGALSEWEYGLFMTKFDADFMARHPSCLGCDVGLPVNVVTGNAWLAQVDVAIPGVGQPLEASRIYHSQGAMERAVGLFGLGWSTPWDRSLQRTSPGVFRLIQANGVPIMFRGPYPEDQTYRAATPATETSWITVDNDGVKTRHFRQGGTETYSASGVFLGETNALGVATTITHVDFDSKTITDQGSRFIRYELDDQNRATSLIGPDGVIASYTYDVKGRLETVTYGAGTGSGCVGCGGGDLTGALGGGPSGYRFSYDDKGQLLEAAELSGRVLERHTYSGGRALTSEVSGGVEKLTLTYSPGLTIVTDALGAQTRYEWVEKSGSRLVSKVVSPCSACSGGTITEETTYRDDGRVLTHKDGANKVTSYTYNDHGDVETISVADPDPRVVTYTYTYASDGRVLTRSVSSPDQGTKTATFSVAGLTSLVEDLTETETRTTSFTYTPVGQLETVTDPRNKVTTFGYDSKGDLLTVTDPLQHTVTFTYDERGRRKTVKDALQHVTTTTYDDLGRVSRITAHDGTYTEFKYDSGGRRTQVIDPLKRTTAYQYDDYSRLVLVRDAKGGETKYGYDAMSRMTSLTDAEGRTTGFGYDSGGRLELMDYPGAGPSEAYTYDSAGRLLTRLDRKGVTTTYHYDDAGRLFKKTYSNGAPDVTYEYDDADRMTEAANAVDTVSWTYDLAGRVLTETSTRNGTTVGYEYDKAGNRLSVDLNGADWLAYAYDDASRLETISRGSMDFGFGYDNGNRRTSMTYPNGTTTSYGYDDLDRLLSITAIRAGVTLHQAGYQYDASGNRKQKTLPGMTEDYGYDELYRLTQATRTAAQPQQWLFGYDKVGNRTGHQVGQVPTSAAYNEKNQLEDVDGGGVMRVRGHLDEAGNVTVNGQPAKALPGNTFEADVAVAEGSNALVVTATDMTSNANTRTTTWQVEVPQAGESFGYDANGNMTSRTSGTTAWTYEWTVENQLARVTKAENGGAAVEVAAFLYDPLGRRVEKQAGKTTAWVYDGMDILRETVTEGATTSTFKYIHGPGLDEPLARLDGSGAMTYYHADGLGSVVRMTDQAGAVVQTRQYDAWGNLEVGADQPGYAFSGREWDPEIGLYYYRARYYDPCAGRFISEDPAHSGLNWYGYASGAPTRYVDPYGLWDRWDVAIGVAKGIRNVAVGAVVVAGVAATLPVDAAVVAALGLAGAGAGLANTALELLLTNTSAERKVQLATEVVAGAALGKAYTRATGPSHTGTNGPGGTAGRCDTYARAYISRHPDATPGFSPPGRESHVYSVNPDGSRFDPSLRDNLAEWGAPYRDIWPSQKYFDPAEHQGLIQRIPTYRVPGQN